MSDWDSVSASASNWDSVSIPERRKKPGRMSERAEAYRLPPAPGEPDLPPDLFEQAVGGTKHAFDRLAYGLKQKLVGLAPEEEELLARGKAFVEETGPASTVGEIGGGAAATAPLGGPVAAGGRVLSRALPALERLGSVGGRVFNLGLAGRAATEGAAVGALEPTAPGESSVGNAVVGAAAGTVIPGAGVLGAGARRIGRGIMPSDSSANRRAYKVLSEALGSQFVDDAAKRIDDAMPGGQRQTRLPQTTAALLDDQRVGALELGARNRNLVGFHELDRDVASRVRDTVLDDTSEAARADLLARRPEKLLETGKAVLKEKKFTNTERKFLIGELEQLSMTEEALADPRVVKALNYAGGLIDDPTTSPQVLALMRERLLKLAPDNPAVKQAVALLTESADDIATKTRMVNGRPTTEGRVLSRSIEAAEKARTTAEQAGAAKAVRDEYLASDGGRRPLKQAIARQAGKLDPTTKGDLENTAEELRRQELYKPHSGIGGSTLPNVSERGAAVAAVNATRLWPFRGAVNLIYQRADKQTQRIIDDALKDPQKFLKIVEAKRALNAPLTQAEELADTVVRGMNRGLIAQGE